MLNRHLLPVERASRPGIPRIDIAEVARRILAGGQLTVGDLAADVADISISQPMPVDIFHIRPRSGKAQVLANVGVPVLDLRIHPVRV